MKVPMTAPIRSEKLVTCGAVLLLTACGGGSGSDSSSATSMMNLQSAPAPAQPFSVPPTTLTATIDGMMYTVTYSATANPGTTTFNGQAASSTTVNVTVQQNGTTVADDSTTDYYLQSPYTPLGITGTASGNGYTLMVTSMNALPSMLMVGQSGTLFSGSYEDASGATLGTLMETYSVTAGTTSALTLTIEGSGMLSGQTVTDSTVFSVNAMGQLQLQQVTLMVNGQAYTFNASMM